MTPSDDALLSEHDLQVEIQSLRQGQLLKLVIAIPLLSWGWLYLSVAKAGADNINQIVPILLIFCVSFASYHLSRKHFDLACWLLIAVVDALVVLLISQHPDLFLIGVSVLLIVLAYPLLGAMGALALTAFNGGMIAWGWRGLAGVVQSPERIYGLLSVYGLALLTSWLVNKPLRETADSALGGWAQARNAMLQMREQRAELHRAVRGLAEANYRIERVNAELIVAQHAAETARELKARFAATVSHELRGPLNLILGFSRLMCLSPEDYGEPLPSSYRADVYTIYRSCQHLLALVDDILDLSQIQAQRLPLVKDRINLEADVIHKAIAIAQPLATRKGLSLQYEASQPLPWIVADAVRLRQTLLNVLLNAVRFTDKGSITVRGDVNDAYVLLTVTDTGRGIAEEDLPKLFKEFSQVQNQNVSEASGSGLGLAISKHLIELHGGTMWAESRVGQGTMVGFTLPLPGGKAQISRVMATDPIRPKALGAVCLVVHEDADIVRLLARYLRDVAVVGIPEMDTVHGMIEQLDPVAIITDESRAPVIARVLADYPHDVPIISCDLPRMAMRERLPNVLAYLVKPIAPEVLTATLKRLVIRDRIRVLIVDDDPDAVRLLDRMLTALPHPYEISRAYDGAQATALLRDNPPDLLLIDLALPTIEGQRIIEWMQDSEQLRTIPTIVVSGRDWIDESVTMGNVITARCKHTISMATGIECLQGLIGALRSEHYVHPAAFAPYQPS